MSSKHIEAGISNYQNRVYKNAGSKINHLLKVFGEGAIALAMVFNITSFKRLKKEKFLSFVNAIQYDEDLFNIIKNTKIHESITKKTSKIQYIEI